ELIDELRPAIYRDKQPHSAPNEQKRHKLSG
ncbi:hypothetical protein ABIB73_002903, partial [Bradyrhizobium sp. F1.4.3]